MTGVSDSESPCPLSLQAAALIYTPKCHGEWMSGEAKRGDIQRSPPFTPLSCDYTIPHVLRNVKAVRRVALYAGNLQALNLYTVKPTVLI